MQNRIRISNHESGDAFKVAFRQLENAGLSKAQAVCQAARDYPESHRAFVRSGGSLADSDGDDPAIYERVIKRFSDQGMSRGAAIQEAAAECPKSHRAWVKSQPVAVAG